MSVQYFIGLENNQGPTIDKCQDDARAEVQDFYQVDNDFREDGYPSASSEKCGAGIFGEIPGSHEEIDTSYVAEEGDITEEPEDIDGSTHTRQPLSAQATVSQSKPQSGNQHDSSNPAMSFPCLDALEAKSAALSRRSLASGPEPSYTVGKHELFTSKQDILLDWGGMLPEFDIAYETWGKLNADKSNAILLHTGLSASSHAHSTKTNPQPGWWEKFIGPGAPLDTDKHFIICTNVIGGCYGSTGPSSIDPSDGKRYATRFPILTLNDMVRAQFRLLDHLGISKLYASVGASMGGMQSLAAGILFPERVNQIVSISGCARSHPYSIAMRHTQRQVLMMDPNWARGFYYDSIPPHSGMKLAREIATVTYRSGPEWEKRFGRKRADSSKNPALCPDFLIETYLDHAGEKFSLDDILFPAWQQREIAESLQAAGSKAVKHVELSEDVSHFGHDTFLLDLKNIGGPVKEFLE
ncbi:homoserine O-acetyltransferase [Trichophyton equinum CBS 127.97]|uniref:Homoserine O-acetyltransferase n=1 Tax=Trichophyton equinum (strain ATCC MYA-4606 / CBS 127.97) TaxID=559882 RepID=F2PN14_TRIEC|nr:homoserine O-acetyltransferase [Trichophyton equinum CBS 127.97]